MPIPTTTTLDEQTVGNIPTEKPKSSKKSAKKAAKKPAAKKAAKKPAAKKPAAKKPAAKKAGNAKSAGKNGVLKGPNTEKVKANKTKKGSSKPKPKPRAVSGPGNGKKPSVKNGTKKAAKKTAPSTNNAALKGNMVVEGTLDDAGWHAVLALTKDCSDVTTGSNNKPSKLIWKKYDASLTIDGDKFKLIVPRKNAAKIPGDFTWFEKFYT